MRSLRPFVKWLDTGRKGNEGGREEGRKGEGARRRRSERRLWRGTGGLALWNALKGREQLSLSLFLSLSVLARAACWLRGEEERKSKRGRGAVGDGLASINYHIVVRSTGAGCSTMHGNLWKTRSSPWFNLLCALSSSRMVSFAIERASIERASKKYLSFR